jgi:hypothetical protein
MSFVLFLASYLSVLFEPKEHLHRAVVFFPKIDIISYF